ncbi:hypothetical protein ACFL0D_05275 [Thermoproteota archaeon]
MGGMWWFWILLIVCSFWFWGYRPYYPSRRYGHYRYRDNHMEIVRERLARGDITVQEYEEVMRTLKQQN